MSKNFGNFMVKQAVEIQILLMKDYKSKNPFQCTEQYMEALSDYHKFIKNLDYKELVKYAQEIGVQIPCPSNY